MKRILLLLTLLAGSGLGLFVLPSASEARALRDAPRVVASVKAALPIPATDDEDPPATSKFAEGTLYPAQVTVDLRDGVALPGDKSAAVIVELSEASANTVIAIVKCVRGKGAGPKTPRVQAVIFRPGDPLQSEARCDIESADRGDTVTFSQVHLPDGARAGERKAVVRVQEGVTPTRIDPNEFRAPYAFTPYGELIYEMDPSDIKISDENSKGAWSTQLPHGRIQPSNRETGYYGTAEMGAVKTRDNIVRLQSERLEAAMDLGDPLRTYPFMAAVLSAKKHRDLHFTYGAVEWEARMPDRTGTWPALWLLPSSGWPPEIDVYEGFSHNPEWTPAVGLSSALHGGKSSEGIKRAFVRGGFRMQMGDFGLKGDLTDEFHKFQARVTPKWITIFVDDVETMRYANPFRGTTWFPLMTIAVKAEADDPFDQGSGAMDIRSLKIWRAED